jgi:hypothetical protein
MDAGMRRCLVVLTAAGLLTLAAPASAAKPKKGQHPFEYGTDISSWYWEDQIDQEVTSPVGLPPPLPPVSQRVRLPSPQQADTLPVAVFEAKHERMAAIKFDLAERGVTLGSEITKLVLRLEESTDKDEHPSYKPETAVIHACPITEVLTQGENEQFDDRPKFQETDCVEGTREAPPPPAVPAWTFDLTKLAEAWGKDPFANNGVMLLGVLKGGGVSETWQVNLKIPSRDDAKTQDVDEYEQTKARATMTLEFVPGDPLAGTDPADEVDEAATDTTAPATSPGGYSTSPVVPSTDLSGAGGVPAATPPPAPVPPPAAAPASPVAQVGPPEPRLPSFVWLLIPLTLLALSAVRSVVLEPVGGARPGGVIEAIRLRNQERRGGPLGVASDPFTRVATAMAGWGRAFRRGVGGAGDVLNRALGAIRRKG